MRGSGRPRSIIEAADFSETEELSLGELDRSRRGIGGELDWMTKVGDFGESDSSGFRTGSDGRGFSDSLCVPY
jgi:hypothetical protein